jgi:hypothetical protein
MPCSSDLAVIASCTERKGLMPRLEHQLAEAGIPLLVDLCSPYPGRVRTLDVFMAALRRMLEMTRDYRNLVLIDAWDILFYGTREELLAKIPENGVIFAAERNCWPDAYLAPCFPGKTPWRFLNSGTLAGTRDNFLKWADEVESHPAYMPEMIDQQWFLHRCAQKSPLTVLDDRTEISYCMFLEKSTLIFKDGKLYNPICDSHPLFLHFNGNSGQALWPHVEKFSECGIRAGILDSYDGTSPSRQISVTVAQGDAKKAELMV